MKWSRPRPRPVWSCTALGQGLHLVSQVERGPIIPTYPSQVLATLCMGEVPNLHPYKGRTHPCRGKHTIPSANAQDRFIYNQEIIADTADAARKSLVRGAWLAAVPTCSSIYPLTRLDPSRHRYLPSTHHRRAVIPSRSSTFPSQCPLAGGMRAHGLCRNSSTGSTV